MADLKSPRVIWAKGILFFVLGSMACVLLLIRHPDVATAALLVISIWAFCRCYYFAFYVIEKYVDPSFRFAGLGAFLRYAMRQKSDSETADVESLKGSR